MEGSETGVFSLFVSFVTHDDVERYADTDIHDNHLLKIFCYHRLIFLLDC